MTAGSHVPASSPADHGSNFTEAPNALPTDGLGWMS